LEEHEITMVAEVTEIGDKLDDWTGPDVFVLQEDGVTFEEGIQEMTDGDDDPFFVNLLVAREGLGSGKPRPKHYTGQAVEDTARISRSEPARVNWTTSPRFRSRSFSSLSWW